MAVVESDEWEKALRRYNSKMDSTPFRELVSRMPGLNFVLLIYKISDNRSRLGRSTMY